MVLEITGFRRPLFGRSKSLFGIASGESARWESHDSPNVAFSGSIAGTSRTRKGAEPNHRSDDFGRTGSTAGSSATLPPPRHLHDSSRLGRPRKPTLSRYDIAGPNDFLESHTRAAGNRRR